METNTTGHSTTALAMGPIHVILSFPLSHHTIHDFNVFSIPVHSTIPLNVISLPVQNYINLIVTPLGAYQHVSMCEIVYATVAGNMQPVFLTASCCFKPLGGLCITPIQTGMAYKLQPDGRLLPLFSSRATSCIRATQTGGRWVRASPTKSKICALQACST